MTSIVALCLLLVLLMFVLVLIAHKAKPRMDKTYFIGKLLKKKKIIQLPY